LFKLVASISKDVNFNGVLLLESITFFNTKAGFILILLLPITILLLPLFNLTKSYANKFSNYFQKTTYRSFQSDLD